MSKRITCLLLVLVLVLTSAGMIAYARQPDRTFTYEEDDAVPSTNIYQATKIIDANSMGTSTLLKEPSDIFVDDKDYVYILDAVFEFFQFLD